MKQGKQKKALLPYQTILRASKGDPIAMETVIGYYRPYMATLAMRESVVVVRPCSSVPVVKSRGIGRPPSTSGLTA